MHSNIGKRRSASNRPAGGETHNNQLQMHRGGVDDLFGGMMERMDRMMGGFGGFGSVFDDFGFGFPSKKSRRGANPRDSPRDPFANILSRFHEFGTDFNKMQSSTGSGKPSGNFVSQTFVYSQKVGLDGKPHVEKYFKSDVGGRNSEGKMVKHGEEMYKNTATGVKKMAQERIFDGKGHKAVKTKMGSGEEEIQNLFHGLEESEQQDFHRRWADESKKLGLDQLANKLPKQSAIESQLKRSALGKPSALALEAGDSQSTTPSQVSRRSGVQAPVKPTSRALRQ